MLTVLRKLFGAIALLWLLGWVVAAAGFLVSPKEAGAALLSMLFLNFVGVPATIGWFGLKVIQLLSLRREPRVIAYVAPGPSPAGVSPKAGATQEKPAAIKKEVPRQLMVAAVILLGGGAFVGGEYFLVKWYPRHQQRVNEESLKLLPYRNAALGIDMQVAAGLYGSIDESFLGKVKIFRPKIWGIAPSLTITSQPNPDNTSEFSPQNLAKWQTEGVYQEIPRYHFEHTKINNRDAILIWQLEDRSMLLTARVISPKRLVEAKCSPGREDETLYMQACESSVHTLKVAGPEPPPTATPGVEEVESPGTSGTH